VTEHPYRTEEQRIAQARVLHDLYQALAFARDANYVNHAHGLGLKMIDEQPFLNAISTAVQTFRQSNIPIGSPAITHEG